MLAAFCCSSIRSSSLLSLPLLRRGWSTGSTRLLSNSFKSICCMVSPSSSSSSNDESSSHLDYDSHDLLLGLDVEPQQPRNLISDDGKLRSWFGPNGQYIRELPCPNCRGRGYTPCAECGFERSRVDCSECKGKGLKTCHQCLGDRVIWEESIDERPWEKARSRSPFKVKEDDEVDNLEIKVNVVGRSSKRVYQPLPPEVGLKISRSLRILNAKTGLFTKRMKILHRDPLLHAQRVAAIKKAKGRPAARLHASQTMKVFFQNPENRLKRSIAMKGIKFHCSRCGQEGHRKHYCPTNSGKTKFRCSLCGERGHNRRTCGKSKLQETEEKDRGTNIGCKKILDPPPPLISHETKITHQHRCRSCSQFGHNTRSCPQLIAYKLRISSECKRVYTCTYCRRKGHNIRTCPNKQTNHTNK
ncbi:hypothetical protein ZOSMA_20G00300 [Zostera marina]|uniref:CCHC-type domain-containing protein n=1 Tax=Zostera marina TaxID=29655 RepID=A0A0K9PMU9_ZOSMR|nr:hypothetical protein ZOSMA_20G00300 [Zostera marina]